MLSIPLVFVLRLIPQSVRTSLKHIHKNSQVPPNCRQVTRLIPHCGQNCQHTVTCNPPANDPTPSQFHVLTTIALIAPPSNSPHTYAPYETHIAPSARACYMLLLAQYLITQQHDNVNSATWYQLTTCEDCLWTMWPKCHKSITLTIAPTIPNQTWPYSETLSIICNGVGGT